MRGLGALFIIVAIVLFWMLGNTYSEMSAAQSSMMYGYYGAREDFFIRNRDEVEVVQTLLWIGSLAFGIGGLVMVIKGGKSRKAALIPTVKQCPYCTETIQQEAVICRYCRRDLQSA